jgi:hypothetical protein
VADVRLLACSGAKTEVLKYSLRPREQIRARAALYVLNGRINGAFFLTSRLREEMMRPWSSDQTGLVHEEKDSLMIQASNNGV